MKDINFWWITLPIRMTSVSIGGKRLNNASASASNSYDLYDAELDINREKRAQQYLCSMAAVQVICISPLMVLR